MTEQLTDQESAYLASLLLGLTRQSITSAAKNCGLNPSNVAGWLKGRSFTLSQEKQNIFLGYLGISGGTLAPDRIHRWKISEDLTHFHNLLFYIRDFYRDSDSTVPEIVRLGPITPHPYHLSKYSFSESLYAITGPFRALVRKSIPVSSRAMSIGNFEQVFRDVLLSRPALAWKKNIQTDGEFGNEPTIRVINSIFDKWWSDKNENVSLEEFDSAVGGTSPSKRYINPHNLSQAIKILDQIYVDYGDTALSEEERSILFEASKILRDPEKQRKFEEWDRTKSEKEDGNNG